MQFSIWRALAFISIACGSASIGSLPARAAGVVDTVHGLIECVPIKDEKARLACFDKAAVNLPTASEADGGDTANTKEMVSTFAPGDFKLVDPDDIHVAPTKFIGKPIELRGVRCFYADKDDYRCVAPSSQMVTAVFARGIAPMNEKEALEADCGAVKKITSPVCRKTIRIVPVEYSADQPNPLSKRIVIKAASIEIVPNPKRKR